MYSEIIRFKVIVSYYLSYKNNMLLDNFCFKIGK